MTLSLDPALDVLVAPPTPVLLLRSADVAHPDRKVAHGQLVRVRRGILAPADRWIALKPWQRYAARVHAVAMIRPGITFCLESAAALLGLPVFGEPAEIHVLDTPAATSRSVGGVRVHTTRDDRAILDIGGSFVTSVIDTVVDVARLRNGAVSLSVADAARRADAGVTVEALVLANENRASSRGRRNARWALWRASAMPESALESVSRAAVEWLGFEEPELQKEFHTEGRTDRSDMWWESARVIGEADGEIKYDGSLKDPIEAIRGEKDRDRRLGHHASEIAHWGWTDVRRIGPLREVLSRAGVPRVAAEASRELHDLRSLLQRPQR